MRAIEHRVTGHGFQGYGTNHWQNWNFWDDFENRLGEIDAAKNWYGRPANLPWKKGDDETTDRHEECWWQLVQNLKQNREMLLYAQRIQLAEWFPDFDPTSPSQLQDTEQPWDYDTYSRSEFLSGPS